ncbi:MAG: hypothetical protein ABIK15_10200 [Pseudomonadota bacterium]
MTRNRHQKSGSGNGIGKLFMILGVLFLIASFTVGCDDNILEGLADDDSFEAKLEEARIALDKGEYDKAIDLLTVLDNENPGNATIQQYLSNAYAGLAGLDTFNLLMTIEALDDSNNSGSIDMMGLILGDSNGLITASQLQSKLENLENAIHILEGISSPNNDHKVQLGILAVAHISLTLGNIVLEDQGGTSVTLTEDALASQYSSGQPAEFSNVSPATLNTSGLTADLGYIGEAVIALDSNSSQDNDLSQDFSQFQSDIDNDGDGSVSESNLETYINNQIRD